MLEPIRPDVPVHGLIPEEKQTRRSACSLARRRFYFTPGPAIENCNREVICGADKLKTRTEVASVCQSSLRDFYSANVRLDRSERNEFLVLWSQGWNFLNSRRSFGVNGRNILQNFVLYCAIHICTADETEGDVTHTRKRLRIMTVPCFSKGGKSRFVVCVMTATCCQEPLHVLNAQMETDAMWTVTTVNHG